MTHGRQTTDDRPRTANEDLVVGGSSSVVVIGYGNELRGDDAVGPVVARAVAAWHLPQVRAFAVHQLTPELAEEMAAADRVIFVDARMAPVGAASESLNIQRLEPGRLDSAIGHIGEPRGLLTVVAVLYEQRPVAWLVTIAAEQFAFGVGLSPTAEHGVTTALNWIAEIIESAPVVAHQ